MTTWSSRSVFIWFRILIHIKVYSIKSCTACKTFTWMILRYFQSYFTKHLRSFYEYVWIYLSMPNSDGSLPSFLITVPYIKWMNGLQTPYLTPWFRLLGVQMHVNVYMVAVNSKYIFNAKCKKKPTTTASEESVVWYLCRHSVKNTCK